jgi:hypothetical protein
MGTLAWCSRQRRFIVPALLLVVLRLPSLAEPHWYTDEAGYITTAQTVLHGATLYSSVWTNKPPLMIYTVATVVHLVGIRIWALHLFTLLCGLVALAAVLWFGSRNLSNRRTLAAGLICATLLGLPLFDAELLVPEALIIAPLSWCCVLVIDGALRRQASFRRLIAAGVLGAFALGIQQTALAEIGFCALVLLTLERRVARSAAFAGPIVLVTVAWCVATSVAAGPAKVWSALVTSWLPYAQTGAAATGVFWLPRPVLIVASAVAILAVIWLTRKRASTEVLLALWSGMTLLAVGAANHSFAHLLVPATIPAALLLASLPRPSFRTARAQIVARGAVAISVVLPLSLASVAGIDWLPTGGTAQSLTWYYSGYFQSVWDPSQRQEWQDLFDSRVPADRNVALWLKDHGYRHASLVVWSSDAWLYALNRSTPTLPTPPIYNDHMLLGPDQLVAHVVAIAPAVIVTSDSELRNYGEIIPLLTSSYHSAYRSAPDTVWVRN